MSQPQKPPQKSRGRWDGVMTGMAVLVIAAIAWGAVIGFVLMRKFSIPSTSNHPTLDVGDYVLTLPGEGVVAEMPWLGKMLSGPPQLGDLSVFRKPSEPRTDYIMRVVGLPGDSVQMQAGVLHINGQAVPRGDLPDFSWLEYGTDKATAKQIEETLPNGVQYATLELQKDGYLDHTEVFVVPAGHYFVLGDNRDNASDSRDPGGGVGFVPAENFVGKVVLVYFSTSQAWPRFVH